jgi:dephospho-CoA kinase
VARRLRAIAITGGIAAGKSEALAAFARRGAAVSSSDEIVHRVYREDEGLKSELRDRWGDRVFDEHGEVDREAVAEIVFADRAELEWLESVLHPRVARAHMRWLDESRYDKVVVVTAPPGVRAARRRGGLEARESRLIPDEEKLRRADFAYVNDGSLEALDAFVAGVVEELASAS